MARQDSRTTPAPNACSVVRRRKPISPPVSTALFESLDIPPQRSDSFPPPRARQGPQPGDYDMTPDPNTPATPRRKAGKAVVEVRKRRVQRAPIASNPAQERAEKALAGH